MSVAVRGYERGQIFGCHLAQDARRCLAPACDSRQQSVDMRLHPGTVPIQPIAHAAGKLMGAFADTVLTVQRRRSGGKQVVQVIHQQVAVGAGGKAIVAGAVKGRGKAGDKRRGAK
jgi:hypothetical protein